MKIDLLVKFDTRNAEEEIRNSKTNRYLEVSSTSSKRALKARRESVENSLLTNRKILERMVSLQEIGAIEENTFHKKIGCFKLKLS